MLSGERKREILAVGLLAAAFFLLLALVPVAALGSRGEVWFPSGNVMGRVGSVVRDLFAGLLGITALALPPLVALGGLSLGSWISRERAVRLGLFVGGLMVLLPTLLHAVGGNGLAAGWLGGVLGRPLVAAFGGFGAGIVALLGLVLLSVATLGWNPLPPLGLLLLRGGRAAARGASTGGKVLAREGGAALQSLRSRGEERQDGARGEESPPREPEAGSPGEGREEVEPLPPVLLPPARVPGGAKGASQMELLPDPLPASERTGGEIPPLELLTPSSTRDRLGMDRELDRLGEILVEKLRTFNVECTLGGRTTGPVVTQFEVIPAPGVKVNRIANLDADLALAMKARSIRIVAPIPGKGAVGVEIPNPSPEVVLLREILEAPEYRQSRAELPLALGKDLSGKPYVSDLARMPHALIAGATGSGKSVCLNTVITSLVYRHTPETLRLLLIDPKMVELSIYADLPHLRHSVVTDPKDAAGVLKWAVLEMERRYTLLSANGVRSLGEFNRRVSQGVVLRRSEVVGPEGEEGDPDRWIYREGILPYIVLVVDELADLMMSVQGEVERPLTLLAQKARAIGIHIILATQRPSVNVITGLIKANFPCRIAFRVASKTDSRTILDQNGADALLGNGDLLFLPPGASEPVRAQGAYIPTEDTDALTGWFRERAAERRARAAEVGEVEEERREEDILEVVRAMEAQEGGAGETEAIQGEWDELFREAAELCIQNDQGSTSLLQRRLKVGYGRAARIVDQLHDAGVLGPPDGSKPREVLITMGELDAMLSGRD